ncbi:protein of unknown function [Methylococcus capsulatus]|uniref:Uncharacterized protein n=1 Tax=Methylococcus capsulatus TaxID=414 RepID=A0AA35UD38_METCP|nr:protein of unknown function [Methylococcus capsulatus]
MHPSTRRRSHTSGLSVNSSSLLTAIDNIVEKPAPVQAKPVYNRMNLVLAVKNAAESFHDAWRPRLQAGRQQGALEAYLGIEPPTGNPGARRRVRQPQAGCRPSQAASGQALRSSAEPAAMGPGEPANDAEKQQVFDSLTNAPSARTMDLATKRVRAERMTEWQSAFNEAGRSSSFARDDHRRADLRPGGADSRRDAFAGSQLLLARGRVARGQRLRRGGAALA